MVNRAGVHEKGSMNVNDVIERIKNRQDFCKTGAIGLFIGVVRGETLEGGEKVEKLFLEAYEEKADEIFRIGFEETEKRILELFDSVDLDQVIQERTNRTIKRK